MNSRTKVERSAVMIGNKLVTKPANHNPLVAIVCTMTTVLSLAPRTIAEGTKGRSMPPLNASALTLAPTPALVSMGVDQLAMHRDTNPLLATPVIDMVQTVRLEGKFR